MRDGQRKVTEKRNRFRLQATTFAKEKKVVNLTLRRFKINNMGQCCNASVLSGDGVGSRGNVHQPRTKALQGKGDYGVERSLRWS